MTVASTQMFGGLALVVSPEAMPALLPLSVLSMPPTGQGALVHGVDNGHM